ncbi:MAG: DUF1194 domain-containing protein [Rhodospirillales bacterium]
MLGESGFRIWRRGLLALALLWGAAASAAEPVDLELVLAADGSGSIDDEELAFQRRGYAAAITHPRVLNAIRSGYRQAIAVAYVEWGGPDSQHTIVGWTKITDAKSASAFASRLVAAPRRAESYNSISEAIAYSATLIRGNAFSGARMIIDVSGDGPQIGGRPIALTRGEAVLSGITINALVIEAPGGDFPGWDAPSLREHYEKNVIGGKGAFVVVAKDRDEFAAAILKKLILEIADGGATGGDRAAL